MDFEKVFTPHLIRTYTIFFIFKNHNFRKDCASPSDFRGLSNVPPLKSWSYDRKLDMENFISHQSIELRTDSTISK